MSFYLNVIKTLITPIQGLSCYLFYTAYSPTIYIVPSCSHDLLFCQQHFFIWQFVNLPYQERICLCSSRELELTAHILLWDELYAQIQDVLISLILLKRYNFLEVRLIEPTCPYYLLEKWLVFDCILYLYILILFDINLSQ